MEILQYCYEHGSNSFVANISISWRYGKDLCMNFSEFMMTTQ